MKDGHYLIDDAIVWKLDIDNNVTRPLIFRLRKTRQSVVTNLDTGASTPFLRLGAAINS